MLGLEKEESRIQLQQQVSADFVGIDGPDRFWQRKKHLGGNKGEENAVPGGF